MYCNCQFGLLHGIWLTILNSFTCSHQADSLELAVLQNSIYTTSSTHWVCRRCGLVLHAADVYWSSYACKKTNILLLHFSSSTCIVVIVGLHTLRIFIHTFFCTIYRSIYTYTWNEGEIINWLPNRTHWNEVLRKPFPLMFLVRETDKMQDVKQTCLSQAMNAFCARNDDV